MMTVQYRLEVVIEGGVVLPYSDSESKETLQVNLVGLLRFSRALNQDKHMP